MKTGKRLLALALMLLMLLSVLPTGALAAYAPFSTSYSYESVTLTGYTEKQLAAFPVSTFLSLLGDEYADAQKIAWTRDTSSDNYTVADAATGTVDLRFLGSHYFDLYAIVGSGNMLDFAGNKQLRVRVEEGYDHLLSSYSLQWRGDGAEWTVCENQRFSSGQYQEMYWVNFFPKPEQAKEYRVRFQLKNAVDGLQVFTGNYNTAEAALASGKAVALTEEDGSYAIPVELHDNDFCFVLENGGVKTCSNVEMNVYVSGGYFYPGQLMKDGTQIDWSYDFSERDENNVLTYIYRQSDSVYSPDAQFSLKMRYSSPLGGADNLEEIESAYVDGGTENIKEQLFSETGYVADYTGAGRKFTLTDKYGYTGTFKVVLKFYDEPVTPPDPVDPSQETKPDSNGDTYFQAKSAKAKKGYVGYFVMPSGADSLYRSSDNCYQTVLLRPEHGAELDMSQLIPTFYVHSGTEAFAKSAGEEAAVKQTSGVSVVDFTTSPVQYTAKDSAGTAIKNYWVTYKKYQDTPALFVNGPAFDALQEDVEDRYKREVLLTGTDDYHDVFFANLGGAALGGLTVTLDKEAQQTLKLDDFWTMGGHGNDTLNAFKETGWNYVTSAAKLRLRLKDTPDKLPTNEISGVMTISSDAGTKYIYLTGSVRPELITDSVPNGVKYVPYSVMLQTNNHSDDNTVSFALESGSLPDGLTLNARTGEIYGVPTTVGTSTFTIRASFSAEGLEDSVKEYTIEIADNSDANVDASSDHTILDRVFNMGDLNDDWQGQYHDQVFRVGHEYAEFVKFFIDGQLLVDGDDYISEEGSTKITIRSKTFGRFGPGTHTIAVEFRRHSDNVMTKTAQNYRSTVNTWINGGNGANSAGLPYNPAASTSNGNFIDVHANDWFYNDVMWANKAKYLVGVSANRFAPAQNTTQAMVVTILARVAEIDLSAYEGSGQKLWYTAAANWAASIGMIDWDTFKPNEPIRRGDLAVMLIKYFDGVKVPYTVPAENEKAAFSDAAAMTAAEEQAFQCCYRAKIFLGNGKNDMRPDSFTTRAQLAALTRRIVNYIDANR